MKILFVVGMLMACTISAPAETTQKTNVKSNHPQSAPAHQSFVQHETSGSTWNQRGNVAKRSVSNAAKDTGQTLNGAGKSVVHTVKKI